MPAIKDISLRALEAADAARIRAWPRYEGEFAPLDYALRAGGWLDMFPESSTIRRFSVWVDAELVGFSLLIDITADSAEFYIAVHPLYTGHGLGRQITVQVLRFAFSEMGLKRVYLKVREWHVHAIDLYKKVGFVPTGHKSEAIQGSMVDFLIMEISRRDFPAGGRASDNSPRGTSKSS